MCAISSIFCTITSGLGTQTTSLPGCPDLGANARVEDCPKIGATMLKDKIMTIAPVESAPGITTGPSGNRRIGKKSPGRLRLSARMSSFPFAARVDRPLHAITGNATRVARVSRTERDAIAVELAIGDLNGITATIERPGNHLIGLLQSERPVAKLPVSFHLGRHNPEIRGAVGNAALFDHRRIIRV